MLFFSHFLSSLSSRSPVYFRMWFAILLLFSAILRSDVLNRIQHRERHEIVSLCMYIVDVCVMLFGRLSFNCFFLHFISFASILLLLYYTVLLSLSLVPPPPPLFIARFEVHLQHFFRIVCDFIWCVVHTYSELCFLFVCLFSMRVCVSVFIYWCLLSSNLFLLYSTLHFIHVHTDRPVCSILFLHIIFCVFIYFFFLSSLFRKMACVCVCVGVWLPSIHTDTWHAEAHTNRTEMRFNHLVVKFCMWSIYQIVTTFCRGFTKKEEKKIENSAIEPKSQKSAELVT